MTAEPLSRDEQLVPGHPGWVWWRARDGHPCARRPGMPVLQAPYWTVLLVKIGEADGEGAMRDQIAELERRFPDGGWVFGTVWQSANSRPDARNLTARRLSDGTLLTAPDVPSLAQAIRREEAGMTG